MQIHGVQRETDPHHVVYVYTAGPGRAADLEVVGHDVEAKVTALIDDRFPQRFFRRRLCLTQEPFKLEVVEINGDQGSAHQA
jgi:hypothetical protein